MRRSLWLLAALAAAIYFVIRVRSILTPFLLGAVIAYLVYPLVQLFEQRFVPRAVAILLVYTVIGFVLGVAFVGDAPAAGPRGRRDYLAHPIADREIGGTGAGKPCSA